MNTQRMFYGFLITVLLFPLSFRAQYYSVSNVDTRSYPLVSAEILMLDNSGQSIKPSVSDLEVFEDNVKCRIVSLDCPSLPSPQKTSTVIMMDVSGSMTYRINLAKMFVQTWSDGMINGLDECALASFNNINTLHQDFTIHQQNLALAAKTLHADGGTDYNKGLLEPVAGALQITKLAKYKRNIVFLTDGLCSNYEIDKIIAEAKRQNCAIYCVAIELQCPPGLRKISDETGGSWFEYISSEDEVRGICQKIQGTIHQNINPCTLLWESNISCPYYQSLVINYKGLSDTLHYVKPNGSTAALKPSTYSIQLTSKAIGVPFDTTFFVHAINHDFTINDVLSSNPKFTIFPQQFTITKGDSIELTLRFIPTDSVNELTNFEFITDMCPMTMYALSRYPGAIKTNRSIAVVYPNGNETFTCRDTVTIRWSGTLPTSPVRIDYSTDNGSTWNIVADKARGFSYRWVTPAIQSTQCLVSVAEYTDTTGQFRALKLGSKHNGNLQTVIGLPMYNAFLSSSTDGRYIIWNKDNYHIVATYQHGKGVPNTIIASNDESMILSGLNSGLAYLWDVNSGMILKQYSIPRYDVVSGGFSAGDTNIALLSTNDDSVMVSIINTYSGELRRVHRYKHSMNTRRYQSKIVVNSTKELYSFIHSDTLRIFSFTDTGYYRFHPVGYSTSYPIAFHPIDPHKMAVAASSRVLLIDINQTLDVRLVDNIGQSVNALFYIDNGARLIVSQNISGTSRNLYVDALSGVIQDSMDMPQYLNLYVSDKSEIVSKDYNNTKLYFTDYLKKTIIDSLLCVDHKSSQSYVSFTDDGKHLYTSGGNSYKWDAADGKMINEYSRLTMNETRFNHDHSQLLRFNGPDPISTEELSTGLIKNILDTGIHTAAVRLYQVSPDNKNIITVGDDKKIIRWDIASGLPKIGIRTQTDTIRRINYHPDSRHLLSVSKDSTVTIWDVYSGLPKLVIHDSASSINDAIFNKGGNIIATCGSDRLIKFWDASNGKLVKTFSGHTGEVMTLDFHPDGTKFVSSGFDRTVIIWDYATGVKISSRPVQKYVVRQVRYSPNAKYIVSASDDHSVMIWNGTTCDSINHIQGLNSPVTYIAITADGERLITYVALSFSIKLWNLSTGKSLPNSSLPVLSDLQGIFWIDSTNNYFVHPFNQYDFRISDSLNRPVQGFFSRVGGYYYDCGLSVDNNHFVSYRNLTNMKLIECANIESYKKAWQRINSNTVISITTDTCVRILSAVSNKPTTIMYSEYDLQTGTMRRNDSVLSYSGSTCKSYFSRSGKLVAVWIDKNAFIYEIAAKRIRALSAHTTSEKISSMFIDRSDTRYAIAADKECRVYDLSTGQLLFTIPNLPASIVTGDFSPIDARIAMSLANNEVYVWKPNDRVLQSDTSDRVFSLVMPICASLDVEMGKVEFGRSFDSVVYRYIQNNGSFPFRVDSIYFTGANASCFAIISGIPPYTISANTGVNIEFHFSPNTTGIKTADVHIVTQAGEVIMKITGEGIQKQLSIIGNTIDFGMVKINSYKDTTLQAALMNIGTRDLEYQGYDQVGPDKEQFSMLSIDPFTLRPGESRTVTIRFSPKYRGRSSGRIGFRFKEITSSVELSLFGHGIGGNVFIPDDSVAPGEHITIPLLLDGHNRNSNQPDVVYPFKAIIEFNASLLAPVNPTGPMVIADGRRQITLSGTWNGKTDTITSIEMIGALGDAESTLVSVPYFEFISNDNVTRVLDIETQSGLLKLIDLCREGGTRLIATSGVFTLAPITPNPASEMIKINYRLIEDGMTRLVVYNMLGEPIMTINNEYSKPGIVNMQTSVSHLPNGKYLIVLETPTLYRNQKFIIQR